MKPDKWFKDTLKSLEDDLEFRLETLIIDLTERACKKMKQKKISRTKLAKLLGVSPAAVTKILNGNSNFTLKTLLSLSDALELDLHIDFVERKKEFPIHVPLAYETSFPKFPAEIVGGTVPLGKIGGTTTTDTYVVACTQEETGLGQARAIS